MQNNTQSLTPKLLHWVAKARGVGRHFPAWTPTSTSEQHFLLLWQQDHWQHSPGLAEKLAGNIWNPLPHFDADSMSPCLETKEMSGEKWAALPLILTARIEGGEVKTFLDNVCTFIDTNSYGRRINIWLKLATTAKTIRTTVWVIRTKLPMI